MAETGNKRGLEGGASYTTSRRALFAAAAVFATMVASQKANAFARPPWHSDGHDRGNGGGGHRCFLRGTRILTPQGEVKVEDLAAGDLVTTFNQSSKPIKWIGRRTYAATSVERWPGEFLPIKVARSALGPMIPHTDLFLSPFHCVLMDGILIPVRNLVNGRSIVHCTSVETDSIEYFHIQLAGHDVIFSEGAPTETLLAASFEGFDNLRHDTGASGDRVKPFAPTLPADRITVLRSRLRSAVSPLIDVRRPGDAVWEQLAERAEKQLAA